LTHSRKWSVPLLESLIPDGLKSGTVLLVEFDPRGQWFALARTIAALGLKNGLRIQYAATARSREEVIASLENLGVDVNVAEKAGLLRVDDQHTATLSLDKDKPGDTAIEDRYLRVGSLKVADLSIDDLRSLRGVTHLTKWTTDQSDVLVIDDSISPFLRFNEERAYLEYLETRDLPLQRKLGRIGFRGVSKGVHHESFYARMEGAHDGLIEVRALERNDEIKNMLRITSLKGQPHDTRWHEIKVDSRGEASVLP